MNFFKKLLFFVTVTITVTSCVSPKDIVYFNRDSIDQSKVSNYYKTVIKPDDLLQINISALDVDAVKPFNLTAVSYSNVANSVAGQPRQQSYLVDADGYVFFPVLGKIKLSGLSRVEAVDFIKNKLDPDYVKNPTVNIRISNFTVSVLGAVNKPGTFNVPNERITLLEAIGLAGDLKISGSRSIKVIRENDNKKKTFDVDLRSNKLFTSPVFYLQQNDVVYVEPNKASSQSAAYNQNSSLYISLAGMVISVITLLTR